MISVYTAFKTMSPNYKCLNGHITTSFTNCTRKLQKISTSNVACSGVVVAVEYWAEPNVTVARIDSDQVVKRHNELMELGLDYGYEFKPHITICEDDLADSVQGLVGATVIICDEYVGVLGQVDE